MTSPAQDDLIEQLERLARKYAYNANYNRASYCAGRAGCDDIRDIRNKPEDYLEWKAAAELRSLRDRVKYLTAINEVLAFHGPRNEFEKIIEKHYCLKFLPKDVWAFMGHELLVTNPERAPTIYSIGGARREVSFG